MDVRIEIETLLYYSLQKQMLEQDDIVWARNALYDLFQIDEPLENVQINQADIPESAVPLLERLLDVAYEKGILADNHTTARDLLDAKIMGLLMPRPSEVAKRFTETLKTNGPQEALTEFYELSKASNYIRLDRIAKNEYWRTATESGELEITINLSKPEKDPREIAALKEAPQQNYPKCLLCIENVGYAGRMNHPARQNHRVLPLSLNGERWYFQYSPYVYYEEHSIVFNEQHIPMKITQQTFARLLDFVEQFPHYFIGSNADLPIVGGSILNHDHFQAGFHTFPMQKAELEQSYVHPSFADVSVAKVNWPMSVLRLSAKDIKPLVELAGYVLEQWKSYSDQTVDLQAESVNEHGVREKHNTITPITWKDADGHFVLALVLRNNRMSELYPEGIFHPHRELHHIKKENIGLIEVMGLAVLPGRLKVELEQIADLLLSEVTSDDLQLIQQDSSHLLHKHIDWIHILMKQKPSAASRDELIDWLKQEVGEKFHVVLSHAGIFKRDTKGKAGFNRFMTSLGFHLGE